MKKNNSPTGEIERLSQGTASEVVTCLRELAETGEPRTVSELKRRIDRYFEFCGTNDIRLGIETLALSLGVNRSKFWRWCQGIEKGQDSEWQSECVLAKQYIAAFFEQIIMRGQINPASGIFYLKNWFNYRDSFDIRTDNEDVSKKTISVKDLPDLSDVVHEKTTNKIDNLPDLSSTDSSCETYL